MTKMTAGGQDFTADRATAIAFVATDTGSTEFLINVDSLPGGIEKLFGIWFWRRNTGVASFASGWIEDTFGGVNTLFETGKI